MNSAALQQRTKKFALRVLNLVEHLPDTIGGRIIANQLARSATSVGANYRAACRARSRAEFASKLGTVAEKSDESLYWLELIRDGKLISNKRISTAAPPVRMSNVKRQTSNLRSQTSTINHQTS